MEEGGSRTRHGRGPSANGERRIGVRCASRVGVGVRVRWRRGPSRPEGRAPDASNRSASYGPRSWKYVGFFLRSPVVAEGEAKVSMVGRGQNVWSWES